MITIDSERRKMKPEPEALLVSQIRWQTFLPGQGTVLGFTYFLKISRQEYSSEAPWRIKMLMFPRRYKKLRKHSLNFSIWQQVPE